MTDEYLWVWALGGALIGYAIGFVGLALFLARRNGP